MANTKNTNRRKRKYNDARKSTTEKNRLKKGQRHMDRRAKLVARTQGLIGQHVRVRAKDHAKPLIGTVLEVISPGHDDYPTAARRHYGSYLRVRTQIGEILSSRHRAKPDTSA